jgi:hypothetical protein
VEDSCKLRAANGVPGVLCDGAACVYWRLVEHLDLMEGVDAQGCAIQAFELLDRGGEVARWLLSVKQRVESQGADALPCEIAEGVLAQDA